jgi:thymidylate kinase
MLALFEARGMGRPEWLPGAVARIVEPDFCFVLDGSAELIVDRVVRRDGVMPGRFDQDIKFTERYNAALRRMAEENHYTVLRCEADRGEILRQCLDVLRGTVSFDM